MSPIMLPPIELRRVLWACLDYYEQNLRITPTVDPLVCYRWVCPAYQQKFGESFHQSKLQHLAKLGYLKEGHSTARGRYYIIADPGRVRRLVDGIGMPTK